LICFLARFGEGFLRALADRSEFCGPSCHPLVRWAGGFVSSLKIRLGGRELVRRFDGRRLWSLWRCLRLDNSVLGKGMSCFQSDLTGFCSLWFSFRLVSCGGRSLRHRRLQTFRFCRTNLRGATRQLTGLFQGLGLHCLLLGSDTLL
jgi:hypothetical protein